MKILVILILALLSTRLAAQVNPGSRITGMGNTSAAIKDAWNVQANVAGITENGHVFVSLNYVQSIFSEDLRTQSFVLVVPVGNNFPAISFQRYGTSEYSEINAGMAYAKKFGRLSLAAGASYARIQIQGYGETSGFYLKTGAQYELNQRFTIGVYCINPARQRYRHAGLQTEMPFEITAGIAFHPTEKVLVAASVMKGRNTGSGYGPGYSLGLDYKLINAFSLRAGLGARPFKQYGGIGLCLKDLRLNMAFTRDPHLGFTPQIDLGYAF